MIDVHYKKFIKWHEPEEVFENLFSAANDCFWLDSSLTNKENRFSYMGANPKEIYSYFLKDSSQDIFTFLEKQLAKHSVNNTTLPFDFVGGFVGYFGYELKALVGTKAPYQSIYPDSLWFFVDTFIAFDHLEKDMYFVCLDEKLEAEKWFEEVISQLETVQKRKSKPLPQANLPKIYFARTRQQYIEDIKECKKYLEKGESYQICLTNELTTKTNLDPFSLYKILRAHNPAPYSSFFKHNDLAILCSSPEQFLKVDQKRNIQTKPIKGTIQRGRTKSEDYKFKKMLSESKKDWSENAMIVDLLRNDLGKICEFGSVKVTKSMSIESYETVHQIVSTIMGKLRNDVSLLDCVKACFPGGSMTGAPKKKVMEILNSLEKKSRGIYSGALGYLSLNQTLMLTIVIRTMIMQKDNLSIGAGGGILMDSDPQNEFTEMLLKTQALLESLQKAVYTTHMHTVFLALGSNVGNKKQNINRAVSNLKKHVTKLKTAKLYETKPMYHEDQEMFLNTVIRGETLLSPQELFTFVKHSERELGRQERFTNGPREIDIDILFYDQLVYESVDLIIPHPRISEREFVLKPFMDISPEFTHPVFNKTMKELYNALSNPKKRKKKV